MADKVTLAQKHEYWTRQWRHRVDHYSEENRVYGTLIEFALDMIHYKRNRRLDNTVSRIQPKGQQIINLIRRKTSQLVTTPITIETRPVQPVQDATPAIVARRVIEQIIQDPLKRYRNVRHRKVLTGLAAGRGGVAIEYDWNAGGTVFRNVDSRRLFPTTGFLDIHDPRMPDLIEQVSMRMSAVRRMGWKIPKNLTPDNHVPDSERGTATDRQDSLLDAAQGYSPADVGDGTDKDGIVTILKCWSRHDPFRQTKTSRVPKDLPPEQWYWTDDMDARVMVSDSPVGPPDPTWRLVTMDEDERELLRYPKGYLCIIAPFCDDKEPLWESSWLPDAINPDVNLRSYPYTLFTPYLHPLRINGLSDAEMNHSLQVIDNASWRAGWEQMRQATSFMVAPFGSLFTADRRPFEPDDRPFQMAYTTDAIVGERIKFFQGPGMNSAMPAFRGILNQQWTYIGSGEVSMPADRSRDVAVGTMQAMQRSGDLPVQLHRQLMNDDEAVEYGVVLDYERAYRADKELVQWVTDKGELASMRVSGADLIPMNVMITASPDWRAVDADRIQALAQFAGQMGANPALMVAMAPFAGLPVEGVQALQRAVAQMPQQPPPGGPPNGGPAPVA